MQKDQLQKLQCSHLRHRIEDLSAVYRDDFEGVVGRLIEEGKRVGKAPWCADFYCEMEAYNRLNPSLFDNDYPQEKMDETVKRRKTQPDLMIEIYGSIITL